MICFPDAFMYANGALYLHVVTVFVFLVIYGFLWSLLRPVWYRLGRLLRLAWRFVKCRLFS